MLLTDSLDELKECTDKLMQEKFSTTSVDKATESGKTKSVKGDEEKQTKKATTADEEDEKKDSKEAKATVTSSKKEEAAAEEK